MLLLFYPQKSYRHPAPRELAEASVVYYNWLYLIAKIGNKNESSKKKGEKNEAAVSGIGEELLVLFF